MNEQLLRFGASSAFAVGTVCGSLPNIAKLPEPHLRFLARSRLKFRNTTGWGTMPDWGMEWRIIEKWQRHRPVRSRLRDWPERAKKRTLPEAGESS